jgi:hypothetical protein
MVTAMPLRERLNETPFRPFRITLSHGTTFHVPNHDVAFVNKNSIEIGIELHARSFAQKHVECAILHVTSNEDIPIAQAA